MHPCVYARTVSLSDHTHLPFYLAIGLGSKDKDAICSLRFVNRRMGYRYAVNLWLSTYNYMTNLLTVVETIG